MANVTRRAGAARSRDRRTPALLLTVGAVAVLGLAIALLPDGNAPAPVPVVEGEKDPLKANLIASEEEMEQIGREFTQLHAREAREAEVAARFEQGAIMLHARRYELAIAALHRVLELAPTMPEAHVNMGFALLGLERNTAAADFFRGAIELRPTQVNAYYGLGLALRALGDVPGAVGAMESYVHLAPEDDPHAREARSKLDAWRGQDGETSPAGGNAG